MKFTKLFSRRRGPVITDSDPLTARRESSPDVHQLKSTRRRNGAGTRRPLRRDGALLNMASAKIPASSRVIADEEHPPCVICRAVDFPSLLDWQPGKPRPWVELSHTITQSWVSVAPLKPGVDADSLTASSTEAVEETPCPYCTFFRLMIGQLPDETGKFTPYLRIRQAFEKLGVKEKADLGKAVLVEVTTKDKELPWGYILKATDVVDGEQPGDGDASVKTYLSRQKVLEGRVVPELLDPLIPNTWMEFCRSHHEQTCGLFKAEDLPGLRLVDCETSRVVLASELEEDVCDKYAALSYVWTGEEADLEDLVKSNGDLREQLPSFFTDAITVTKNLGLQYLWIDKLCLPPDSSTRGRTSSIIGDIFHQAAVALIPATDDTAGIPGISIPREEQLSLQTDAGLFTTSLLRPDLEVGTCQWATQARTFQEGTFSRRRLVFTPSQCYFQCCTLHCHESIGVSLHLAPSLNLGRVFPQDGGGTNPGQFKDQIKAFIPRQWTTEEERLAAFEGVLKRYRQMGRSVDELLALPLFHQDDFNNDGIVSQTDRLAVGLGWMPNGEAPAAGKVDPYVYHPSPIGKGFPSWTWLSWHVRPGWESVHQDFRFSMVGETSPLVASGVSAAPKMEISVAFTDGKIRSWEIDGDTAVRHKRTTSTGHISFLRVTTWCFDLTMKNKSEEQDAGQEEGRQAVDANLPKSARDRVWEWYREAVPDEKPAVSTPIADALISKPLPDPEKSGAVSTERNDTGSRGAEARAKDQRHLVGLLLSGRGWQDSSAPPAQATSPTPAGSRSSSANNISNNNNTTSNTKGNNISPAFTILICIASTNDGADGTKLRRLGALHVPCDGFASVGDRDAILRGVETEIGEKKALKLDLREVDLW